MLATIRKAALSAGFTFAGTLGGSMADGDLTRKEAIIATGAALVAAAIAGRVTWRVPNAIAGRHVNGD
jgi:hypothetical protein